MKTSTAAPANRLPAEGEDVGNGLGVRELQRRARVKHILETAAKVFLVEGYANFSSRRVAAEAGVNLSLLQHYFGSHDKLLIATVDSIVGAYPERYRQLLLDMKTPARKRLEILIDDSLDAVSQTHVCRFMFQALGLGAQDEAIGKLVETRYGDYVDAITELVLLSAPKKTRREAEIIATMMASQMDGQMYFQFRGGSRVPPFDQLRKRIKQSLLKMLDD